MDWFDKFVLIPEGKYNNYDNSKEYEVYEDYQKYEEYEKDEPPNLIITPTDKVDIPSSSSLTINYVDEDYDHREILTYGSLCYYDNNMTSINHEKIIKITKKLWINDETATSIPEYYIYLVNVIELYANNNNFETIPEDIINLKKLRHLCFYDNQIKIFPSDICYFKNLRMLDLGSNLIGEIPPEVCQLSNLRRLYLNDNLIEDLPEELFQLTKLLVLELQNNYLSDISNSIIMFESLKYLDISDNDIEELTIQVENFLVTIHKVIRDEDKRSKRTKKTRSHMSNFNNNHNSSENRSQRGRPKYNLTNTVNQPSFPSYPPPKPPVNSIMNTDTFNFTNKCCDKSSSKQNAEFDELCRLSDIELGKPLLQTLPTVKDQIPEDLVTSIKALCNNNNAANHKMYEKLDYNNLQNYDTESTEDYDTISLNSSDNDLREFDTKTYYDKEDLARNNFDEFIRENYRTKIIKNIIEFTKFYDDVMGSENDQCDSNRDMMEADKIIKGHLLLSDMVKCKILDAMEIPNLLNKLNPTDKEPTCEEKTILCLHPKYLFNRIITIIEMLPIRDILYEIIDTEVSMILDWDIKNVSAILDKIYSSVDNYQSQTMLDTFSTYCH